jgi:glutamyl-tRNA reductase
MTPDPTLRMPLAVVGVSHRTAPVEVREQMAFAPADAESALVGLRGTAGIEEAVLLSTCNRTEVYLFPATEPQGIRAAEELLRHRLDPESRRGGDYLFRRRGDSVVRHLFQVSSGIDSMVMGEAEIQGQVREAYELATRVPVSPPMAGPVLNRLFQMALAVGGRVRSETTINEGTASVASVAVELARKIFGSLRERKILVLGAGATAELMVEALAREGVRGILVANRTLDRAVALAGQLGGQAIAMDGLVQVLPGVDIVLSSTAAPHPILTRDMFRSAFPRGRRHPLLAIDIAIPRDLDPRIGDEPEVFLYNVDDLRKIVDEHVQLRAGAVPEADRIIQSHSEEFRSWYASLQVVPVIREMRAHAELHRQAELDRLYRTLGPVSDLDRERLEDFSRRLLNKLMHEPTSRLRHGLARGGGLELVDAVRFLFGSTAPEIGAPGGAEIGIEGGAEVEDRDETGSPLVGARGSDAPFDSNSRRIP